MFYKIKMDVKISMIMSLVLFGMLTDAAAISSSLDRLENVPPIYQFQLITTIACFKKPARASTRRSSGGLTKNRSRKEWRTWSSQISHVYLLFFSPPNTTVTVQILLTFASIRAKIWQMVNRIRGDLAMEFLWCVVLPENIKLILKGTNSRQVSDGFYYSDISQTQRKYPNAQ